MLVILTTLPALSSLLFKIKMLDLPEAERSNPNREFSWCIRGGGHWASDPDPDLVGCSWWLGEGNPGV